MENDGVISFWPAFADFMLALVLIFLVAFGITELGGVDPDQAKECQSALEQQFRSGTPLAGSDVEFRRDEGDPFLLNIRFADKLLFASDRAELSLDGEGVLARLTGPLSAQLPSIREIQIHGHADIQRPKRFPTNVHLAAERAVSVFSFLAEHGIDPSKYSMSATSYGHYFPVNRLPGADGWTEERLEAANADEAARARNRRVELLVRYGSDVPGCPNKTPAKRP